MFKQMTHQCLPLLIFTDIWIFCMIPVTKIWKFQTFWILGCFFANKNEIRTRKMSSCREYILLKIFKNWFDNDDEYNAADWSSLWYEFFDGWESWWHGCEQPTIQSRKRLLDWKKWPSHQVFYEHKSLALQ